MELEQASKPVGTVRAMLDLHSDSSIELSRHGTSLPTSQSQANDDPKQEVASHFTSASAYSCVIIASPYQLGWGPTYATQHMNWLRLDATNADGDALLQAVYTTAKAIYSLSDSDRLNLLQFGISLGGASTLGFHMYYLQQCELQQIYELKLSVPISGHYSADVWISSVLLSYSSFKSDANIAASFDYAFRGMARRCQYILLTHLLHTYLNVQGLQPDIVYDDTSFDVQILPDDWQTQMLGEMIPAYIPLTTSNCATDTCPSTTRPYGSTRALLTETSWNDLIDTSSSAYANLVNYLHRNSVLSRYPEYRFNANTIPIDIYYAYGDMNVPCQHAQPGSQFHEAPNTEAVNYFMAQLTVLKATQPAQASGSCSDDDWVTWVIVGCVLGGALVVGAGVVGYMLWKQPPTARDEAAAAVETEVESLEPEPSSKSGTANQI